MRNAALSQFCSKSDTDSTNVPCVWDRSSQIHDLKDHIESDHGVQDSVNEDAKLDTVEASCPLNDVDPLQVLPSQRTLCSSNFTFGTLNDASSQSVNPLQKFCWLQLRKEDSGSRLLFGDSCTGVFSLHDAPEIQIHNYHNNNFYSGSAGVFSTSYYRRS